MPKVHDEKSKEDVRKVVDLHTNPISGYDEVTEEMRMNITSLAVMNGYQDDYVIEKFAKMYAEPIYYLRTSLEQKFNIAPGSLVGAYKNEERLQKAQKKREEVKSKLMRQTARQFRFFSVFLNNTSS